MNLKGTLAATAVLAMCGLASHAAESPVGIKNVVLVHGGFVDGSGWSKVYHGLRKDGFSVSIVQNHRSRHRNRASDSGGRTVAYVMAPFLRSTPPGETTFKPAPKSDDLRG